MNPDLLADEQACARLTLAMAHLVDNHDVEGFIALFTEDAELHHPTGVAEGRAAMRAVMDARPRARVTRHVLAPPLVERTAADAAEGLAYFTMYAAAETDRDAKGELPLSAAVMVGEYRHTYRRVEGRWLIARHRIVTVMRPREAMA